MYNVEYNVRLNRVVNLIGYKKIFLLKKEIRELFLLNSLPHKPLIIYRETVRRMFLKCLNERTNNLSFTSGITNLSVATIRKHLSNTDVDILNNIPTINTIVDSLVSEFLSNNWFSDNVVKTTANLDDLLLLFDLIFFSVGFNINPYHLKKHLGLTEHNFRILKNLHIDNSVFNKPVIVILKDKVKLENPVFYNSVINNLTYRTLSIVNTIEKHYQNVFGIPHLNETIYLIKAHDNYSCDYFLLYEKNSYNSTIYSEVNVTDFIKSKVKDRSMFNIEYKGYKHNRLDIIFDYSVEVANHVKLLAKEELVLDIIINNDRIYLN